MPAGTCPHGQWSEAPDLVAAQTLDVLDAFEGVGLVVGRGTYEVARLDAPARLEGRDLDDWPILATAMALDCPIWTEDQDSLGTGVPTWTTDRVELLPEQHR